MALDELKKANAKNILFVCGDIHIRTFPQLLLAEGIKSEVIKEGIGIDSSAIAYRAFEFAESTNLFSHTDCFCHGKVANDQMG
jgi:hypothetical protein